MSMEDEVIRFFKNKLKQCEGSVIRGRNLNGFIASNARVRKWFLERYPSEACYMEFFLSHPNDFTYSRDQGLKINKDPFLIPDSIREMEQYDARQSLEEVEKSISQIEIFAFIFFDLISQKDRSQEVPIDRYLVSNDAYYQGLIERLNLRREDLLSQIAKYRNVMRITDGNRCPKLQPCCVGDSSFPEGLVTQQMTAMVQKYLKALVNCNIVKMSDVVNRLKRLKIMCPRVFPDGLNPDILEEYIKKNLNQNFVVKTRRDEKFISPVKVEADAKPSTHLLIYESFGEFLSQVHGTVQKIRKNQAVVKVDSEKHSDFEGLIIELDISRLKNIFPNDSDLHKIFEEEDEIVVDAEFDQTTQKYYVLDIRGL